MVTIQDIEEQLVMLRKKWETDPAKRDIIRRQARALEIAKEMLYKKYPNLQTKMFKG